MKKLGILSLLVLFTVCSCSTQESAAQPSVAQTEEAIPASTLTQTLKPAETNLPTETIMPVETIAATQAQDACIDGSSWENAVRDALAEILNREIELEFVDGSELDSSWNRIWSGKLEEDSPNTHEYAFNILLDCVFLSSAISYVTDQDLSETDDLQAAMIAAYGDSDVLQWNKIVLNDCAARETVGENFVTTYSQPNGQSWTSNCLRLENGDYSIKLNVVY